MKQFSILLAAFFFALAGAVLTFVGAAWAGGGGGGACVLATGMRNPPLPMGATDFCVSEDENGDPVYPGDQADSNGDGFGTRCDGDYRRKSTPALGDCATDCSVDYPLFVKAFRAGVGADQDHDGNGVVNANDFTIFRELWFLGQTPD